MNEWCFKPAALIPLIIVLSMVDAALTLVLVERGASEINPLMARFLEAGPVQFLLAKLILTSASLLLVLLNQEACLFGTSVRAKSLLPLFLMPFTFVVQWELYLIFFFP